MPAIWRHEWAHRVRYAIWRGRKPAVWRWWAARFGVTLRVAKHKNGIRLNACSLSEEHSWSGRCRSCSRHLCGTGHRDDMVYVASRGIRYRANSNFDCHANASAYPNSFSNANADADSNTHLVADGNDHLAPETSPNTSGDSHAASYHTAFSIRTTAGAGCARAGAQFGLSLRHHRIGSIRSASRRGL